MGGGKILHKTKSIMKKTLLLLASAALLLLGCAKEQIDKDVAGDGELANVTISAQVQGEEMTKAAIDGDGKGIHANRCIMVLYYADKVYGRYETTVNGYKATFDVKVPAKRTYKAVFWADCAAEDGGDLYYNTADLTNITLKSKYVGNDDKRDAFFKCEEYTVKNVNQSFSAKLTRPFAQINVITKDVKDLHLSELYPQKVNLSFEAATSFNAMSGECGDSKAITYKANVYKPYDSKKDQLTLSMDYLFAGDRSAVDINFKAPTEEGLKVEYDFSNIPYERNYRTNIVGNLLTADAHWEVTIKPNWNKPDEEVEIVVAGSVAAANEAFANGATYVKIASVGDEKTLYLPQTEEEVTIDFANPSEVVTVKYGPAPTKANVAPAAINIATNDVTKFTLSGINNVVWLVGNQAALANALTNATNKQVVALSNDITMNGEWTPVISKADGKYYIGTFDGKNHVISNLKISDYTGTYAGFFSTMSGATIKNVTFKNAIVTNAVSNEGARGAVIVGWTYAGVIDNCHVINSSVTGGQKVAGILGCISVEGAASKNEVINCSVEGLTLSSNISNDILYQAGALVGYIQLVAKNPNAILIENNSVKDITINDAFGGPDNQAWYSGTFIGSIIRKQQIDGQKIVLNNNTISGNNTELYKSIYSSEYFGWTTNTENYAGAIAPIVIDGQEWTPDYPIKNVTKGKGYATLNAAVSDASAGDEIKITAAGTYTVPGISKNVTITGAAEDDVVFNCVGSGSIASISSGATFKNVTMNFGQSSYHGFQHAGLIVMEGCTLNGLFFSYGDMTFTGCTFNQEAEEYNMWCYGNDVTYDGCTFNSKGKFLNVYCESNAAAYNIVAKDCVFNTSKANKSALNIKETSSKGFLKYNVTIENCSCNELQNTLENKDDGTLYRISPIWQVDDRKDGTTGINITVDGVKLYPFYSTDANGNFHVANAKGLLTIAKDINKSKDKFYYKTIFLDADIDLANAAWTPIAGGMSGDFDFDFDGQNHEIKNVTIDANGSKNAAFFGNWAGDIKNLTINAITVTNGDKRTAALVGQMATGTIENCHVINATIKSVNYKVGGLVGSVTADPCTIKNCSVKNSSIEGLEQVGGFCGSLGTGDGGATKFIGNVVENIKITSSNPASAKANTFGAYVGTYYAAGYVAENTNNTVSGTNNIYSANEGFGILLQQ